MKSLAAPFATAWRRPYNPQALWIVCLNHVTSSPSPLPVYSDLVASTLAWCASYSVDVGKIKISASAGWGRNSGSSRLKTSWNSSCFETPNRCINPVKTSGSDSRGTKCFLYCFPLILVLLNVTMECVTPQHTGIRQRSWHYLGRIMTMAFIVAQLHVDRRITPLKPCLMNDNQL